MDNEDVGKPVADYFGISGNTPKVIIPLLSFSFCVWMCLEILDILDK
jgi:hypothetical protein